MKWFKAFSINSKVMEPIVREFGHKGHSIALIILEEAQLQNIWELDIERLKKWTGINKRTAEKMVKVLSKFLQTSSKLCANFDESFTKVSPNFDESFTKVSPNFDESFTKVDASNPRGPIKDREIRLEREERIEREETPPTPQGGSCQQREILPSRFEEFWVVYPNKKAKAKARSIWERKKLDDLTDQIISKVKLYAASSDWLRDGGMYIPHPTTFLSQERWEDEIGKPLLDKDDEFFSKWGITEREYDAIFETCERPR